VSNRDSKLTDIACIVRHETERAWLIDVGLKDPVWIPKSQAEVDDTHGTVITMPEWLAQEKGLI
jgi:hypothetical protein